MLIFVFISFRGCWAFLKMKRRDQRVRISGGHVETLNVYPCTDRSGELTRSKIIA
jgi:hypothetical protein